MTSCSDPLLKEEYKNKMLTLNRNQNNLVLSAQQNLNPLLGQNTLLKQQKTIQERIKPITNNGMAGILPQTKNPIVDRGIVPKNTTIKRDGIEPAQDHKYTLRTDPMWDYMKREMLDPNIAAQKKLHEARELESFNQAWDRIHGVKNVSKDGNVTGLATDVNKKIRRPSGTRINDKDVQHG